MLKRILVHTFKGAFRAVTAFILVIVSFLPAPFLDRAGLDAGVEVAHAVPTFYAHKRDTLVVDNDADNLVDPGDTLRYTVIITNFGTSDASSVLFADTIDANTTLVPGSVRITPIARNDVYFSTGNVGITVPAASGVLVNDNDPDGTTPVLTIFSFDAMSANGGEVTVNADGSFTYNPPPGFEGTDFFHYAVLDSDGTADPASVFIVVSDMVWFVDNSAATQGDGRLNSPFNSLDGAGGYNAAAADDPGDSIFLHSGSGPYTGGIVLLNGQSLIGQGATASIEAITGITLPPFSNALPATGGSKPTIENSSGDGIALAADNLVRGLAAGNASGSSIAGFSVGTLTISEVIVNNGSGGGIEIAVGTLNVALESLAATSSGDEGIDLANVSGSFAVPGGSISNTGSEVVRIDGNPSLSLNVTLDSVSASGATEGILVRDTTGSFTVTGSGSTDGSGGTISSITNRGASFVNSTGIALGNMTFNNAPTADGPTCTSLDNSGCNAAIHLENTSGVVLTNVDISATAQQGINGLNVTDFTLESSTATQCGDAVNEGCLRMVNLAGTAAINNSDLSFAAERVAQIDNTNTTLALTVANSTFRDTQSSGLGADGLEVTSDGASNTTIDVVDTSFLRNRTNGLQVFSEGTSFVSADVSGSTFDRGAGIGIGLDLAAGGSATLHFNVVNNPLINSRGSNAVNVFADGSATVQGRINNNTIEAGGSTSSGFGIRAQANTDSSMTLEIDGNTISNIGFDAGIQVLSRLGGTGRLDATINNNTVTVDATNSLYDIWVQAQDSNTTCANVTDNSVSGVAVAAFRARTADAGSTVILQGAGATAADVWSNNGNTPASSPVSSSHNGTLTLGGACNTVTHPTAAADQGLYLATRPGSPSTVRAADGSPVSLAGLVEPLADAVAAVDFGALWSDLRRSVAGLAGDLVGALRATPAHASGESVYFSLGDLNPGQVVMITFDVTVDTPFPPGVTQVCNQGVFSGNNFFNMLTDDEAVGGVQDPTCTLVQTNTAPVADDDSYSTDEDTILNVAAPGVLDGDTDADNDPLTAVLDTNPSNGTLTLSGDGSFSYAPDADYCGSDSFAYHANDGQADSNVATVDIEVLCVNDAPLADDDSYPATEDSTLNVLAPGVLSNDTDADGDALTAVLDSTTGDGTLALNGDGSFSYTPDADYCGPDSFTYHANDGQADSNVATVDIEVVCVDDPPTVAVDVNTQAVQYSDYIGTVTVTASDPDSSSLAISDNAPAALSTSGGCMPSGSGTSCTWTLEGQVLVAANTYDIDFTVSDATTDVTVQTQLVVEPEDATVGFDGDNPVAVPVESPGGDSGPFTLLLQVQEAGESGADAAPGDINLADVSLTLVPVGPGSSVTVACVSTGAVAPFDYGSVLTVQCDFDGVPVNTYALGATVAGGYYLGMAEDVLVVYDASLGFTTGGGWTYWPGTQDRTNFGYTMKYNKQGNKVQGNLLLIRHLPDGTIYRVKSNAIDGLALGDAGSYGWATFSGKTTYLEPGWPEPVGNHTFVAYVEDHGEPGAGADRFWIEVQDKDGNVVALSMAREATDNAVVLEGGNIVVPH